MSHALDITTGVPAMAYVGDEPWHGLGQRMEPDAPIDDWVIAAGLNYNLITTQVDVGGIIVPEKMVLYRDDTRAGLGIVSPRYHVVQPREVLEFFREWTHGVATIETAGALFGGKRYWALARLAGELDLDGDITRPYILLTSSCDGSLHTAGRYTSIRVVCNNTLTAAVGSSPALVKISHRTQFDPQELRIRLEEASGIFDSHFKILEGLVRFKVDSNKAVDLAQHFFDGADAANDSDRKPSRRVNRIVEKFTERDFIGSDAGSTKETAYGLLQCATEYFDHEFGRTQSNRLANAWTGEGSKAKMQFADFLAKAA